MAKINPNKATAVSQSPPSTAFWPVVGTKDYRVPRGKSGRSIGAYRPAGGAVRTHAGIDLFAAHRMTLRAMLPGTIVSFYYYYRTTYALIIDHGDFVVNYGEVAGDSLEAHGLKTPRYKHAPGHPMLTSKSRGASKYKILAASGSKVTAGQPIAKVGKMFRSSMLHIEFFVPGTLYNIKWDGVTSAAPSGVRDPTQWLLSLSNRIKKGILPTKEATPREVVCR